MKYLCLELYKLKRRKVFLTFVLILGVELLFVRRGISSDRWKWSRKEYPDEDHHGNLPSGQRRDLC